METILYECQFFPAHWSLKIQRLKTLKLGENSKRKHVVEEMHTKEVEIASIAFGFICLCFLFLFSVFSISSVLGNSLNASKFLPRCCLFLKIICGVKFVCVCACYRIQNKLISLAMFFNFSEISILCLFPVFLHLQYSLVLRSAKKHHHYEVVLQHFICKFWSMGVLHLTTGTISEIS